MTKYTLAMTCVFIAVFRLISASGGCCKVFDKQSRLVKSQVKTPIGTLQLHAVA
jgi:hypothetical protein